MPGHDGVTLTLGSLRDSWLRRIAAAAAGGERVVAAVGPQGLLWRPDPASWGVGDCLEHLVVTGNLYLPRFAAAWEKSAHLTAAADKPYRLSWFGRRFAEMTGGRVKRRLTAPRVFQPPPASPDAPERFAAQQRQWLEIVEQSAGLDLSRIRITLPVGRVLSLRAGDILEALVGHMERHLQQAERAATRYLEQAQ